MNPEKSGTPAILRRQTRVTGEWPEQIHPVLRRVYAARGATSADQVIHRLAGMLSPTTLGGIEPAVRLLAEAIEQQRHICIVGDFDADGATGTALAVRGLRALGATRVSYRVPHRLLHGYGLSPALVADLQGNPDVLVTVDNGIACLAGVAAAKAAGRQVIVTDHHLPGPQLPEADAIVNPNVAGDPFPSKALAGVGVMFYLLLALRAHLRDRGAFVHQKEPDFTQWLDLVALGTVADMVPLDTNNRILVAAGLRRLRAGQGQAGLRALMQVSGRDPLRITSADLGFALGPRINAAGRLEDMALGIECLLTDDDNTAKFLAAQLDGINQERRAVQDDMLQQAETLAADCIARIQSGSPSDAALCVFDPDWHPGVVGLVASRLKDRLNRPVIAFAPAGEGDELRGSARSISGFHIRDALADLAATTPDLIVRFGGHAMAAGLTLRAENLARFTQAFVDLAGMRLTQDDLRGEIWTDGRLQDEDICRALAEQLRDGGPWGQGFPAPLFDDVFELAHWRVVGNGHLKMQLRHPISGRLINAIEFGGYKGKPPPSSLHVVYQLEVDDFCDRQDVQLLIRHRFAA